MSNVLPYLAILVLLIFSAFFSSSEIAFSSANELRLKRAASDGGAANKAALTIYEKFDKALVTILIGNNLVNIASSSIATVIAVSLMGDSGAWVATLVMTIALLTFGEILPKVVAASQPNRVSRFAAIPLRVLMLILSPLVWCVNQVVGLISKLWQSHQNSGPAVTEDDLETILDTVEEEGVMDEDACDLLQSALDFEDVLAYEIITPRVDVLAVDVDDPPEEIVDTIVNSIYSRIPVYEGTVDNIIGMLHLNQCLKLLDAGSKATIREQLLPVQFIYKTTPLPEVLKTMRMTKCHMAVVTDEYGGTMGVLTMEDVIEQLVGDIWDESDVIDEEFVQLGPDHYEADGDMRIYDFFDELDIDDRDFDDDNATLGGWTIEMVGGYPKVGDSFTYKNLTVTVKEVQGMRVTRLDVAVQPPEEDSEEDFL